MTFDLTHGPALLARTPAVLGLLLRGLPDELAHANEGTGTFSTFDVVGHLIHGERTDWIPRARIIMTEGESRAFNFFDRFAQLEASRGKGLGELLSVFAEERQGSLAALREMHLTSADLERRGRHPDLGVVTLGELLATWVAHDLDHLAQIARVLGKHVGDGAGPWKPHLRILRS